MSKEIEFPRTTVSAFVVGLLWILGGLFVVGQFSWYAIYRSSWPWIRVLVVDVAFLGAIGFLIFSGWANLRVQFTETAVIKPGITKKHIIQWSEVTKLEHRGGGVRITGAKSRITFSPHVFKEPQRVFEFIEKQTRPEQHEH